MCSIQGRVPFRAPPPYGMNDDDNLLLLIVFIVYLLQVYIRKHIVIVFTFHLFYRASAVLKLYSLLLL